jgi:CubicO group peptidase (beta-lactamase class C family)
MRAAKQFVLGVVLALSCTGGFLLIARPGGHERIKRIENGLRPYSWAFFGDEAKCTILERMKFYRVPGVSLAVIENGRLAWTRAYGVKDMNTREPVTVDTLFQAASIGKPLNAAVIMIMAGRGKLALDTDVNAFLRSWKVPASEFTAREKVTVSRLLSHTGGICNFNDRTGYSGYDPGDPLPTVEQMLRGEAPAKTPPVTVEAVPGTVFRYSNPGETILQLVLMELEGKPYQRIMKENLLDPLGMGRSVFIQPLPDDLKKSAASAHDGWRPLAGGGMVYPELAAAGLWSTPADLAKFIIWHWRSLRGRSNRLLSQSGAARMIALTMPGSDYSEAFEITRKGDEVYYGHRGGNYGFYGNMIINRDSGNGAVVMVNGGGDGVNSNLKREILNAIAAEYGWKNYLPPLLKIVSLSGENTKRSCGRFYVSEDSVIEIKAVDGKFSMQSPDRGMIEIFPVGDDELVARTVMPLKFKLRKGGSVENDELLVTSGAAETRARRMDDSAMVPFEYLASGRIDQAVQRYRALQRNDPAGGDVRENRINALGYALLNQDKAAAAVALFKLNAEWYPRSANTFDSLAEAYARTGERELAIENYEQALKLKPESASAREALKKLREN